MANPQPRHSGEARISVVDLVATGAKRLALNSNSALVLAIILLPAAIFAQQKQVPKAVPLPVPVPSLHPTREIPDPESPAARTVTDTKDGISFDLPKAWNLTYKDGEVSTYRMDARTASRRAQLRAVATLAFNPYPLSTFSGATFYLSVTPATTAVECAAQTKVKPEKPLPTETIAGITFHRGKDEHGKICTEARDIAYTTMHGTSCIRFDTAINTFCGGEVSGAEEITDAQLSALFKRMEGMLETVKFSK